MYRTRFEVLARTYISLADRVENALTKDNWFDTLNKLLFNDAPRRTLLRAAATLTGGLLFGDRQCTEAAKNRKKKRKWKRKKAKPRPMPQSCSGGACAAVPQWAGDDNEIAFCELMCERCPGTDPQRFCILGGEVADCCDEGLTCCGDICVNTFDNDNHCGTCNHRCSPGKVCFGADCLCRVGLTLCGDICRDTNRDENHCGGCETPPCTGFGMQCCDGNCVDVTKFDNAHCGSCLPCDTGEECCFGVCLDPRQITCCRDRTGPYWRTCPVPEVCSEQPCTPNGGIYCCPP